MRKLIKTTKPTEAQYFKSESQRKRTNRLAFITASKPLVAIITVLVVASIGTGAYITQKQRDSKAATRTAVIFNDKSTQVDRGRWQTYENVAGASNGQFEKSSLSMTFKNTYGYTQGYTLCYTMSPEGSASYPNLTYTSTTVNYTSTERGSTKVSIRGGNFLNVLAASNPAQHSGGAVAEKSLMANLNGLAPGSPVFFCLEKVSAGNTKFQFPINATITSYSFTGAYDKPDAPVAPTTPAPAQTTAPAQCVPVHKKPTAAGIEAETASATRGDRLGNNEPFTSNCTYIKVTADKALQHVFTANSSANTKQNYALIVRGKGKVKATLVVEGRGGGKVKEFNLTSNANSENGFSTTNILSNFNNTDQNISGDILKDLPSGKKVTIFLAGNSDASVDWLELRKSGNESAISQTSAPASAETKKTIRVSGTVKLADGTGIPNAKISDCGKQTGQGDTPAAAKTGANGQYFFDVPIGTDFCVSLVTTLNGRLVGNSGFGKQISAVNGNDEIYYTRKATATDEKSNYDFIVTKQPDLVISPNPNAASCPQTPAGAVDAEVIGGESGTERAQNGGVRSKLGTSEAAELVETDNTATGCRSVQFKKPGAFFQQDQGVNQGPGKFALRLRAKGNSSVTVSIWGFGANPNKPLVATVPLNSTEFKTINVMSYFNGQAGVDKNLVTLKGNESLAYRVTSASSKPVLIDWTEAVKSAEATTTSNGGSSSGGSGGQQQNQNDIVAAPGEIKQTSCSSSDQVLASFGVLSGPNAAVVVDTTKQNSAVVALFSNNESVECKFKVGKGQAGSYTVGAQVRSQDANKIVAKAKLSMTGKGNPVTGTFDAPKNEKYGNVFSRNASDYRVLNEGDEVTVKVTFANDGKTSTEDRNLLVYSLMLVKGTATGSSNVSTGTSGTPRGSTQDVTTGTTSGGLTATVPCNVGRLAQVNANTMSAKNTKTESDGSVRLLNNTSTLECTLYASEQGTYNLEALVKNDSRAGLSKALVKLEILKDDKVDAKASNHGTPNGNFGPVRMSQGVALERNQAVKVRITSPNSQAGVNKRQALVNQVRLVSSTSPVTTPSPVDPATDNSEPVGEVTQNNESVSVNSTTGTKTTKIQAESNKVKRSANVKIDSSAANNPEGGQVAVLTNNKDYIQYEFIVDTEDYYTLSFGGLSEDINLTSGSAKAKVYVANKAVKNGEIQLERGSSYKLYSTTEPQLLKRGSNLIKIEFTGDSYNKNKQQDRNLRVDYLQIRSTTRQFSAVVPTPEGGFGTDAGTGLILTPRDPIKQKVVEAENAQICQSNNKILRCSSLRVSDPKAVGDHAIMLKRKGDYAEVKIRVPEDGQYSITPTVRSQDYLYEGARYDVFVNGKKDASNFWAYNEDYNLGYSGTKRLKAGETVTIKVVFKNDECGDPETNEPCNAQNDRNLLIDQFKVESFITVKSVNGVIQLPSLPGTRTTTTPEGAIRVQAVIE